MLAVKTENLGKTFIVYKSFLDRFRNKGIKIEALKNVDLKIKKKEIFGLLGPNGAGKTTFVNIISTLLLPDSGRAEVFGLDVVKDAEEVRKNISLSSAYAGFYHGITVKEGLKFFAMLNDITTDLDEIISLVGLEPYKNTEVEELSSGNKQKLSIAKSLLINPKLLLLDELTVALDPRVASEIRKLIFQWRRKNKTTILLTTHNMLEAEELCDRIAILHRGRIRACDTPAKLKKLAREEEVIEIVTSKKEFPKFLLKVRGVKGINLKNFQLILYVDDAEQRLNEIIKSLTARNYHIKCIKIRRPTLEDVFLKLTGAELE